MLQFAHSINHAESSSTMAWREKVRAHQYQIDLAKVAVFDSSLLALLLDLRRSAISEGQTIGIHNAPAKLVQLATLYGVNELIA